VCPCHEEGCCPHGGRLSARPDDSGPADLPDAGLTERVSHLYQCSGLSTYRIAAILGISRQGIRLRGRGGRSPFVRRWRAGGDPEGEQAGSGGTLGA
jgi:hypothetical protein